MCLVITVHAYLVSFIFIFVVRENIDQSINQDIVRSKLTMRLRTKNVCCEDISYARI
jgi:hypothetical protein